jgi:ubiquinone/menaquinone biosynthesis C-methylase UbiE
LIGGHVIGIDIDQRFLDELSDKIEREQLADRFEVVNQSLFDLDFPVESFDVI